VLTKSSIGVQQILPRTSADWQGGHHAPERRHDDENHNDRTEPPPSEPPHAPPSPGLGKIVDKTV